MKFASRSVALFALFGASTCALGSGTISLQYLVNTAAWTPTDFSNTGSWNTYNTSDILVTNPGLQIPGIQQAFISQGVPVELRGALQQVSIRVEGFTFWDYTVDNGGGVANATVNLSGTLAIRTPVTVAPSGPPYPNPSGTPIFNVLTSTSTVEPNVPAQDNTGEIFDPIDGWIANFTGTDTRSGTAQATGDSTPQLYSSGSVFDAFNSSGTVYLPITFSPGAANTTSGNFDVRAFTFGAARVTVTYTYLPESEWAWAGLPFVAGGWLVRRKLVARLKS